MLILKDLSIGYDEGGSSLIAGLSVSIANGSLRLLQGPSGCGKSTLLSVVSGTAPPSVNWSGDVLLDGLSVTSRRAEDRGIGLMFQDPLLFPHMSVGDNLAFGLAARYRRHRRQRVEAALEMSGLVGFADRDPATLSGGQAARLALMRTLLAEPKALLMDEAFSALDPDLRQSFGQFVLSQIRERNIPALLVSHDAGDASFADDDVIRL